VVEAADTGGGERSDSATGSGAPDDPGMVRAGAAAAARRRELNVSQRSLAADGVINAGALIAFEKGRSWPRQATRAKLEAMLQWPAGTIERIRRGESVADGTPRRTAPASAIGPSDEIPLIAQAVVAAANTFGSTIDALPAVVDPEFTPRATGLLADLRQLEAVATRAARIQVTPELIRALSTVRSRIDELTMRAADAPSATLGQRLYAARRRASLTVGETALAAGLAEDVIVLAEAEQPLSAADARAVEQLITQIDWR
jgi:DNA-binding XRE family transcriptional regulator